MRGSRAWRFRCRCWSMPWSVSRPARRSWPPRAARGATSTAGDEHADRIETVVVGIVQGEARGLGLAERGAPGPVLAAQAIAQARAPVALEDDALDVVARGVGQGRPALEQVRAEALHGQPGPAKRRQGALPALLEGRFPALVAAALHRGLTQAALEVGVAGQEDSVQELGFLHDDAATGTHDAGELAQRATGLLDVMQNVAAPDPVEARVGCVELRGLAFPELETRRGRPGAHQGPRRLPHRPPPLHPHTPPHAP